MKVKKFKERIQENARTTYDYGCAMIYFYSPDIQKIVNMVKEEDLHEYGLEKEQHVTLLYGLHKEVTHKQVFDICEEFDYEPLRIYNLSLFENKEFDVLKLEVDSDVLYKVNEELQTLPNTQQYPNYIPHVTIAYLKPGLGKKYLDIKFKEVMVEPLEIVYSYPNGEKIKKPL